MADIQADIQKKGYAVYNNMLIIPSDPDFYIYADNAVANNLSEEYTEKFYPTINRAFPISCLTKFIIRYKQKCIQIEFKSASDVGIITYIPLKEGISEETLIDDIYGGQNTTLANEVKQLRQELNELKKRHVYPTITHAELLNL